MTNKEKFERLRQYWEKNKLTIYNESWRSGYFIFELGEDSVVHFKIKELRGWLFGVWFLGDKDQIFAQPINNIDKFKPSRSVFVAELDLEKDMLYGTAEIYGPLRYSYYFSWYRDNRGGAYPKSWFHAMCAYYAFVFQQIYWNFIGWYVGVYDVSEWTTFAKGGSYPFKCIALKLKYGKKVVWNRWRKDHKTY